MTDMPPLASVVIPAHNAQGTLGLQLAALARQDAPAAFEVVVALNRCTDGSKAIAESFADRLDIHVVRADTKPSAAYARNTGADKARGQVLLFCDADDQVSRRWVRSMVAELEDGGADFVGGTPVVNRLGLPDWAYRRHYEVLDHRGLCRAGPLLFPLSASLGVTKRAFESVDGFDETFEGAGCEEVDLALRLVRHGWRIGFAPEARFLYTPRTSMKSVVRQQSSYMRGAVRFGAKESLHLHIPSRYEQIRTTARLTTGEVVRRGERSIPAVISFAWTKWATASAARRAWKDEGCPPNENLPPLGEFVAPLETPVIHGLGFEAEPGPAHWYATGGVEQVSLLLLERLLPEGATFVDVGANVGVYSIFAGLCVGPQGRVVAFEPDPRTRGHLLANVNRHGLGDWVEIREEAVGDEPGQLGLHRYSNDTVSGFFKAPEEFSPGEILEEAKVEVITLDQLSNQTVDVIKIDVEGAEPAVLAGAAELLRNNPLAPLLVELNSAALAAGGSSPGDLLSHFPERNWQIWAVDDRASSSAPPIRRLDSCNLSEFAAPGSYYNLLVVPADRAHEVEGVVQTALEQLRPDSCPS